MTHLRVAACALVLVVSGLAHGVFTNRWRAAADFGQAQAQLDGVARTLGTWTASDIPMSTDELDRVSIRAHLSREYRDARTGQSVRVLVVAGPPGPISVHTPDVCFQGTGFEQKVQPAAVEAGGCRVWGATFAKGGPVPTQIRVYWGWHGGSGWEAPEHRTARYKFAFQSILFKVYLVTDASAPPSATQAPAAEELAARLLPELDRAVSSQP